MDAFRANFPELFDHILEYLYPIDLVRLSMVSHQHAQYYPKEFAQWRRNVIPANEFIGKILYTINPPMFLSKNADPLDIILPIHAGTSKVMYNGKCVIYSYCGNYKQTVTYCNSSRKGYRADFEIRDGGKVKYSERHRRY